MLNRTDLLGSICANLRSELYLPRGAFKNMRSKMAHQYDSNDIPFGKANVPFSAPCEIALLS